MLRRPPPGAAVGSWIAYTARNAGEGMKPTWIAEDAKSLGVVRLFELILKRSKIISKGSKINSVRSKTISQRSKISLLTLADP